MKLTSHRTELIASDIRGRNYQLSLELERKGEKILKLNTGNPATFGFPMPESVKQALAENLPSTLGYCDVRGMIPARESIFAYHKGAGIEPFTMDDIFIGNGISEIGDMVATALFNPGDEILIPAPCYSMWFNNILLKGAVPVYYPCVEENGWNPDTDEIRARVTDKTKAIVIINPNNPTGAVYSVETLNAIADIAREHGLVLLADEIYDRLVFDDAPFTSIAKLAPDVPVITMNGLSKSHCLCGFRIGWLVVSGPEAQRGEISAALLKLASLRLCANTLAQTVVSAALADSEYTKNMLRPGGRLYEQSRATWEELDKLSDCISYVKNAAGLYVFPKIKKEVLAVADDREFAHQLLLNKHILLVPGSGFAWPEPDHFRIVMLPQPDDLRLAVREMGDFIRESGKKGLTFA